VGLGEEPTSDRKRDESQNEMTNAHDVLYLLSPATLPRVCELKLYHDRGGGGGGGGSSSSI
jgi:hypothetical protein